MQIVNEVRKIQKKYRQTVLYSQKDAERNAENLLYAKDTERNEDD